MSDGTALGQDSDFGEVTKVNRYYQLATGAIAVAAISVAAAVYLGSLHREDRLLARIGILESRIDALEKTSSKAFAKMVQQEHSLKKDGFGPEHVIPIPAN
jgi:hypothetical protein